MGPPTARAKRAAAVGMRLEIRSEAPAAAKGAARAATRVRRSYAGNVIRIQLSIFPVGRHARLSVARPRRCFIVSLLSQRRGPLPPGSRLPRKWTRRLLARLEGAAALPPCWK